MRQMQCDIFFAMTLSPVLVAQDRSVLASTKPGNMSLSASVAS